MLNDTYAVTDLNVLNVDTHHKIRASSVGRASYLLDWLESEIRLLADDCVCYREIKVK